jgi:uridine kinase
MFTPDFPVGSKVKRLIIFGLRKYLRVEMLITVSAYGGGGKTTVAKTLAKRLDTPYFLKFDDFESIVSEPQDYSKWIKEGASYDAWDLDKLKIEISRIKIMSQARHVIFDYPFGYAHSGFKELIDYAIYIDVPLDIAMARRFLRNLKEDRKSFESEVEKELDVYLRFGRQAYLEMDEKIKPYCDLVIDGTKEVEWVVSEIVSALEGKNTAQK